MKMYFVNDWPLASKEWSLDSLIKPCEHSHLKGWEGWAAGLRSLPSLLIKILDKTDFYLYETLKNITTVLVWNPFFTATDFLWSQVTASFHPSCLTPPRNISLATASREGRSESREMSFNWNASWHIIYKLLTQSTQKGTVCPVTITPTETHTSFMKGRENINKASLKLLDSCHQPGCRPQQSPWSGTLMARLTVLWGNNQPGTSTTPASLGWATPKARGQLENTIGWCHKGKRITRTQEPRTLLGMTLVLPLSLLTSGSHVPWLLTRRQCLAVPQQGHTLVKGPTVEADCLGVFFLNHYWTPQCFSYLIRPTEVTHHPSPHKLPGTHIQLISLLDLSEN